jgi:RNA polymerase sigma factor (sigma-70 family)
VLILRNPAAAEDAAQEGYLRAFKAWKTWKQEAPAEAWLYRIALNVAFTHRRRERLYDIGEIVRRLGRPRETDPTEVIQPDLVRELRALPPKQAAAIVLRHLHGFTNREIAAAVGMTGGELVEMYRLLAIAKYEERYVIPTAYEGEAHQLEELGCSLDVEGGPGMTGSGPFGEGSGTPVPVSVETFHALRDRQTSDQVTDTGKPGARINLLNWDGKAGTPPGRDVEQ